MFIVADDVTIMALYF